MNMLKVHGIKLLDIDNYLETKSEIDFDFYKKNK